MAAENGKLTRRKRMKLNRVSSGQRRRRRTSGSSHQNGIAGIVLTIGTAVDSNVLIYERIREEVHAGRSIVSAIQAGFDRAFATIIDSNSTMAIAAVILFFMGSGPVRGFAVVFILGILTTVITAVTLTRMMIALWYHYARPKALPF